MNSYIHVRANVYSALVLIAAFTIATVAVAITIRRRCRCCRSINIFGGGVKCVACGAGYRITAGCTNDSVAGTANDLFTLPGNVNGVACARINNIIVTRQNNRIIAATRDRIAVVDIDV